MRALLALFFLAGAGLVSGCDMLGVESTQVVSERRESDGKAIGAACRHAGRAIEDCYALNRKAERAAIFAGWREMNDYMRENKVEPVPPQLVAEFAVPPKPAEAFAAESAKPAAKAGTKKHN
jgi:hypothetical protein